MHHRLTLWLHPRECLWLWRLEITNERAADLSADAVLVQDLGLADRGFLMNNEAYASQYIDHHVAHAAALGPVVMSRQNLAQGGSHPWILHACLEGAAGFATDALQVFGPAYRDADRIGCDGDGDLPNARLQHEVACVALQSRRVVLQPGSSHAWTFVGLYEPNHTDASSDADLAKIALAEAALGEFATCDVALSAPVRSIVQDAQPLAADVMSEEEIAGRYPVRTHEEHRQGRLLSFFVPEGVHNRHVVLRDKERQVARRHGTLLRSGQGMLPDEATMCATGWMHGVFGAQLTIGNTSFHKLFSVSRDPYNITRASGLRILVEIDAAWRLLAVPSAFDMGLSDCRWIYRLGDAHDHRACGRRGRRAGDAMADRGRGTALPLSRLRPSRHRRARARPRRPHRDRRDGQRGHLSARPGVALWPTLSRCRLSSRRQHARYARRDRRR